MSGRARPRRANVRMILVDDTVRCAECGERMPPGTVLVAIASSEPCEPARLVHDGRCPVWTPTVIHGGRTGAPIQHELPLLAVVPETTTRRAEGRTRR